MRFLLLTIAFVLGPIAFADRQCDNCGVRVGPVVYAVPQPIIEVQPQVIRVQPAPPSVVVVPQQPVRVINRAPVRSWRYRALKRRLERWARWADPDPIVIAPPRVYRGAPAPVDDKCDNCNK